jgi:hypothetical protein
VKEAGAFLLSSYLALLPARMGSYLSYREKKDKERESTMAAILTELFEE